MRERTQAIYTALDALQSNPFVPQSIATFIRAVVTIQQEATPIIEALPHSHVTDESFASGTSLYTIQQFSYDKRAAASIFGKLLALLSHDSAHSTVALTIKTEMEEGRFSLEEAFTAYLHTDARFFERWNAHLKLSSPLLLFLLHSSLAPSLELFAHTLIKEHSIELWSEQYCPCCGSDPLIAYWLDSTGKQHNICSFCATEYRVARMQCTYCGEKNHEQLRYIATEEVPSVHIQTCATCNSYIKILDRKSASSALTPHIDDVATLIIDVVAKQQGFLRPVLSAFGF
ncbi:MAG: formate dehydrogenase accessory protein FdhE [Desulfovibrionaceae bacterium]|nr:formate dehydrogenase accessory protein FdhE [Desulfovibrionaceae bacterium]